MLYELCLYTKNWFDKYQPKFFGDFKIEDGVLISLNDGDMGIVEGQYYRIVGSKFNDGVYKHGSEALKDESFNGAVWLMAVDPTFEALALKVAAWCAEYAKVDSENMSPYTSESFGGYSYSKSSGGGGNTKSSVPVWQGVFADELSPWRKI